MKGAFITIEGIDGSGKDTLAQMLKDYLEEKGIDVLITREPGDVLSGKVRDILINENPLPLTEMLLFMADRHEHVKRVIEPFLKKGGWVISVRYSDSSMAYQGARGVDRQLIEDLNIAATTGIYPDLTILMDLSVDTAINRVKQRGKIVEHFEKVDFLEKVRRLYLEDAAVHQDRFVVVDASRSPQEIFNMVKPYIDKLLEKYSPVNIDLTRNHLAESIVKAIDSGMHAFLLYGQWGCGHEHLIRNLLYKLLPSIREVDDEVYGLHPDLMLIKGEKPSSIKIDVVRSIGEFLDYHPVEAKYRIVVIDDASYLTLQASNALLKILEEPPEWGIFFLYTSYLGRILDTIRSRCLSFRIERFPTTALAHYIVEHYGLDTEQAYLIATMSEGCPGRIEHMINVIKSPSVIGVVGEDFYKYIKSSQDIVDEKILWDKLFYEIEDIVISNVVKRNDLKKADILLQMIEFEGMLNANVQRKLIADLIYWKLREVVSDAHLS